MWRTRLDATQHFCMAMTMPSLLQKRNKKKKIQCRILLTSGLPSKPGLHRYTCSKEQGLSLCKEILHAFLCKLHKYTSALYTAFCTAQAKQSNRIPTITMGQSIYCTCRRSRMQFKQCKWKALGSRWWGRPLCPAAAHQSRSYLARPVVPNHE